MPIKVRADQLAELGLIRGLEIDTIKAIADKISALEPPPIKPSELRKVVEKVLPPKESEIFVSQLISLCSLRRRHELSPEELLDELLNGIKDSEAPWNDEDLSKWKRIEPYFKKLLSSKQVWNVVKALDLSYDYTNIFESAKILTDIRPIFNEDAIAIEGAVISNVFRIFYYDLDGSKSISIAIDDKDLEELIKICKRAQDKAKTAKSFMEKTRIKTFSPSEEE